MDMLLFSTEKTEFPFLVFPYFGLCHSHSPSFQRKWKVFPPRVLQHTSEEGASSLASWCVAAAAVVVLEVEIRGKRCCCRSPPLFLMVQFPAVPIQFPPSRNSTAQQPPDVWRDNPELEREDTKLLIDVTGPHKPHKDMTSVTAYKVTSTLTAHLTLYANLSTPR